MAATYLAEAATETDLVYLAQQGDRNAFGELVRRHYQGVVRVVYSMCGDAGLAEDATQEAFIRAWVNLPSFQPSAPLKSWIIPDSHQCCPGCSAKETGRVARGEVKLP